MAMARVLLEEDRSAPRYGPYCCQTSIFSGGRIVAQHLLPIRGAIWMRLRLFGFSNPEDRFEKWLAQRHQERVLGGDTIAAGPCPDSLFLRSLAKRSSDISMDDPRVSHAANC